MTEVWHSPDTLFRPDRKLGYISLRFMKQSKATLAMQRWPITVSIECAFLRGFPGTKLGIQAALALGDRFDATFHWGQLTPPGYGRRIPEIYTSRLRDWQVASAAMGIVPNDTFSTEYSQAHQLETNMTAGRSPSDLLLLKL